MLEDDKFLEPQHPHFPSSMSRRLITLPHLTWIGDTQNRNILYFSPSESYKGKKLQDSAIYFERPKTSCMLVLCQFPTLQKHGTHLPGPSTPRRLIFPAKAGYYVRKTWKT
ncbi:hypothetical protein RRG08_049090 [Elysia crispata]|uniref:Uncharacterized protein n=1 Tax=Elysia crispata TaxID=231223 RepID=A0AAE1AAH9_9GAST|nr:hypothetical protein RRG08_049090 [Elysia crispata]